MTKSQDSPKTPVSTSSPFEAGRQWLELAAKAQKVFLDQIKPDAAPPAFMPQDVAHAFSEMVANLMRDPSKFAKAQTDLWQSHAALWQDILTKGFVAGENQQPSKDRRFKDEEWDKNVAFNTVKRNYLIGAEWLRKLVGDQKDLPRPTQKKLEFFTERFIDAVSPTNFVATTLRCCARRSRPAERIWLKASRTSSMTSQPTPVMSGEPTPTHLRSASISPRQEEAWCFAPT